MATSLKVFCSEQSSSRGGIEIAQLVADWLIRLPIRTCVKPPVTSDCSLAPKLLFVDWLKILANEKQAVQFPSPLVLVCEQNGVHTCLVLNCMIDSLVNTHHLQQYSPFSLHYWSSWIMSDQTKVE